MKRILPFLTILLALVTGCNPSASHKEFPNRSSFKMEMRDYESVKGKTSNFRPYLTPYARWEKDQHTVLFGFIFHDVEDIVGVAYLLSDTGAVLDSLDVCGLDPPNETWAQVGDQILVLESGGMMEEGPLPLGRTSSEWVDTLRYGVGENGFVRENN